MYKVEYQNQKLKTIFSNLDTFVDSELEEELQSVVFDPTGTWSFANEEELKQAGYQQVDF